jgi:hypothetical protein
VVGRKINPREGLCALAVAAVVLVAVVAVVLVAVLSSLLELFELFLEGGGRFFFFLLLLFDFFHFFDMSVGRRRCWCYVNHGWNFLDSRWDGVLPWLVGDEQLGEPADPLWECFGIKGHRGCVAVHRELLEVSAD